MLCKAALILKESMEAEAAQQDLHNAKSYLAALQAEGATPREIEGDSHTHFLLCAPSPLSFPKSNGLHWLQWVDSTLQRHTLHSFSLRVCIRRTSIALSKSNCSYSMLHHLLYLFSLGQVCKAVLIKSCSSTLAVQEWYLLLL